MYWREEAKRKKKNVLVFDEAVAATGGYLIACPGDKINQNKISI